MSDTNQKACNVVGGHLKARKSQCLKLVKLCYADKLIFIVVLFLCVIIIICYREIRLVFIIMLNVKCFTLH